MPFSDHAQEGMENKLASLVASEMGATVQYTWWSERKSFAKTSLAQGACDLILGVTAGMPDVLTTQPYYRSTYVFLSRRDRDLRISSLADEKLSELRIGVHVVGDDYAPPAFALAHRGLTKNVIGFSLFGPSGEQNTPAKLVHAVADGSVDVAIIWGPFAGYFAKAERVPMDITPVRPPAYLGVPFTYDIAAAVANGNDVLRDKVGAILQSHHAEIQELLNEFGIPQVQ